eukprot:TRINITY_DN40258_c0_g1_i1.p1 TRINITY_DN40258_c0_g1~~TRINITY_DN40258_c0_g1_i1.p1  ORF type:complete len:394 (+),score=42.06 TRINITY_DN40258_c0_g1_i1:51-1232(+)
MRCVGSARAYLLSLWTIIGCYFTLVQSATKDAGSGDRRFLARSACKIDVVLSADQNMLAGVQVAIASVLHAARAPERMRVHVVVSKADWHVFSEGLGMPRRKLDDESDSRTQSLSVSRTLFGRAVLILHSIPSNLEFELRELFPRRAVHAENDSSENDEHNPYARWWKPTNFVRFFIDDFLPYDSDRVVWLDADVVVRHDVAELADELLTVPSKTIAFARYPGHTEGFRGAYNVRAALSNQRWASDHMSALILGHPVWNAGVLAFNTKLVRTHHFRNRVLSWIKLKRSIGLYEDGGTQTPLDLAALTLNDPSQDSQMTYSEEAFHEVDCHWNCWWGFLAQTNEANFDRCKIIHFADKRKPWQNGTGRLLGIDEWNAATGRVETYFPLRNWWKQ